MNGLLSSQWLGQEIGQVCLERWGETRLALMAANSACSVLTVDVRRSTAHRWRYEGGMAGLPRKYKVRSTYSMCGHRQY